MYPKHKGRAADPQSGREIASPFVVDGKPLYTAVMRTFSKREAREFYRRLAETRPIPQTELEFINPFTLLVAVVLSAQATDSGVNKATPALFALADTPEKMLALGEERIVELIRTIGLFRTKAKNLAALSRILVEKHGGEVPRDRAALEALPGVGRKTANVVLNVAFGEPTIAVDTHIFRVANRTGIAPGKTPLEVETGLEAITPAQYKRYAHHWLILHGRYVCQARKPDCPNCVVADLCRYGAKTGPAELIAARASSGAPEALSEPAVEPGAAKAGRARARRLAAKSQVGSPRKRAPRARPPRSA
jgi:endonuclease III